VQIILHQSLNQKLTEYQFLEDAMSFEGGSQYSFVNSTGI